VIWYIPSMRARSTRPRPRPCAAAALILAACGGSGAGGVEPGARLYATYGCASCHGGQGAGGTLAPPLADLGRYWDREGIADYLRDPRAWLAKDPRLEALQQRFSAQMPAVSLPEEQRLMLADHVLQLSAALPP